MKAESYPVVYLETCFIGEEDLSKAIEAQGFILIATIERMLDGKLDDSDRVEVSDLLDDLTSLVVAQGSSFRSDEDINTFTDGSTPIIRMEPTCLNTAPLLPDITEIAKGFEHLGDFAEHLVKIPGFRVVVNEPPQCHAGDCCSGDRMASRGRPTASTAASTSSQIRLPTTSSGDQEACK